MNTFDVVKVILSADVTASGTITVPYPAKRTIGNYQMGVDHSIAYNGLVLKFPVDWTVSFGATSATVTMVNTGVIPAGSAVFVQLNHTGAANPSFTQQIEKLARAAQAPLADISEVNLAVVELGSPAASSLVNVAALQTLSATGPLTLVSSVVTADVPRNIQVRNPATNDLSGLTVDVTGHDLYGVKMSENIVPTNTTGTVQGKKAFADVTSAVVTGTGYNGGMNLGFGNTLGIPLMVPKSGLLIKELQDGAAPSAGTLAVADQATPTATTGDIRGTYIPNAAPDASKSYALVLAVPAVSTGPAQFTG